MAIRTGLRGGISLGAFTIALGAFALPHAAFAQEASVEPGDQTVEETEDQGIVVTGFRESLETAVNLKRSAPVIAEAFSAEDVGKLPDVSIAETLGRLPGLAVQRINGRAQSLSIRGLGPDYSTSLLNGRELVSSGDNRAVEFDQYPSELINQGVVYKTPYAGLIGQGLAGTVDLRTIRPLSTRDRVLAVSARAEFNEDGSLNPDIRGWGYRATGTYVDKFADDTLGLAVGLAYQSSPSQVEKFNAWGYPQIGQGDIDNGVAPAGSAGTTVLGGMKPFAKSVLLDRLGAFGTLEWQPNDNWNTSLDVFYADYKENIPTRGIEFPLNPGWGAGTRITNVSQPGTFSESVTWTNVQPVVRNDYERKDTTTWAVGWNTKYENDDVLVNLDLSYSKSDRRLQQIESYSGLTFGGRAGPNDTIVGTRQSSGFPFQFTSQINYADTNLVQLTDPRGWGGGRNIVQAGFINDTATDDDLWSGRLEVVGKVENPLVKQLVAGFAYADRTKSRDITQSFLSFAGAPADPNNPAAILRKAIPADALIGSVDALSFIGIGPQVAYDPFVLLNNGTYVLTGVENSDLPFPGDWTVNEKVYTGYMRADLDTMLGSVNMVGNIGAQLVFTDQSSEGFNSPGGIGVVRTPVSDGAKYADFLPSATFNFDLADNFKLRLGAARTLTRARMDQLNASYNASISNQPPAQGFNSIFRGDGGNPRLRPYRAWSVDGSVEYYFGGAGYVSLATYYKWLDDFVNPSSPVVRDFSQLVPTLNAQQRAAFLATGSNTLGLAQSPDNTATGHIFGVEASLSLPFNVLSQSLDGFGFQTSASYTDSELTVSFRDRPDTFTVTVPGLSEWVVNSTAYFEKAGFEARLSHRFRTSYLAEFIGISASRGFRQTYDESIFDAQIGYRFQTGSALEGLSITLQALNLTDEPFVNFVDDDESHVIDYERFGRTYLVGISYRM